MSTKLYPPQIAGSLPAFCKTYDILQDLSIGARITIPFVMNAGVGEAEVKGFALRLKTASSNTYIFPVLYSTDWDKEKSTVTFEIEEQYANLLNEGQFYKVQLAYYNYKTALVINPSTNLYEETVLDISNYDNFIIGYYSTVGIIKCISKPKISIDGYSFESVNLFNGSFLGVYDQRESSDTTEKVYSYRFDFYDIDDNIVHTSGELIHNINNDSEYNYSIDRYICNDFIQPTEVYKLVYTVTTMNGYVGSSPRYKVTANTRLAPGRLLEVVAVPNIEDGCINVSCKGELGLNPEGKMEEALYYGEYLLSRASEEDGFVEWEQIQEFRLANQKPSTFCFYDFSVKQGIKYIYAIQQFNMSKLYSTKILSPQVSVDFEDMFLFDGERSLRIRFNPRVTSFKTTVLEKKIETIGSKYPFIFRNGAVGYKEFPVEGLISYHIDENQRFFKRDELYNFYRQNEENRKKALNARYIEYQRDTDLTEYNIMLERQFKTAVLEWLNNGEPKLFKSATEGNFIVRLINTSLTPEETLGRMLHTFKSTAIEVAECTLSNLKKFGFAIGGAIGSFVPLWRTYDFTSMDNSLDGRGKELKFDQEVTSFKIEGVLPRTKVFIYYNDSQIPEEVIIGATGHYAFANSTRKVIKLLFVFENNLNIQGHIECEYMGRRYSNFDAITDIRLQTIISNQTIGINPKLEYMKNSSLGAPAFELAVKALIDTNYRTYLNKYLSLDDIQKVLDGKSIGTNGDWKGLLFDLDIMENGLNENGEMTVIKKENSNFDPSDTIQYIKTDFYDYERNKISVLNMEQAVLRQRELIPVYVVPYEMITPETWDKMPNKIYRSKTSLNKDTYVCEKVSGKNYLTRDDYERIDFPTWQLFFSTTPFGQPYPIDELITYLTLQIQKPELLIDKHFVYAIYKYNKINNKWELINNYSDNAPSFSGSYYDPYHEELLQEYKTTFYINDKYRYDPVCKNDIIKKDTYSIWRANDSILTRDKLYIKQGNEYISATDGKFSKINKYKLWDYVEEPEYYYIKTKNEIDLSYSKQMCFEQLGEVSAFGISNGIIAEQTFQLQMMDYYTEVNDLATAQAKAKYQEAFQFLKDVFRMFDNIEQADMKQNKFNTLYQVYNLLLTGCEAGDNPLNAYDFLIMLILLEKEEVEIELIEKYFLPRLDGPTLPPSKDIINNLRILIDQYKGSAGVPMLTLIQNMFYTENDSIKNAYNSKQNIMEIMFNEVGKYGELKLIDGEESDLYSLFTNGKITGLDAKNQSLKKLYDVISAEVQEKEIQMNQLQNDFGSAQQSILWAYDNYNEQIGRIAANEWIKRLRELNSEGNLLDFLTTAEQYYTEEANNMNMESQYQQEQIDKWRREYRSNYENLNTLIAENSTLQKIQADNEDDDDLDSYLQTAINKNLKQMVILGSQMEIIETSQYNGIDIFTDDELKNDYPSRKIPTISNMDNIYITLVQPKLKSLNANIEIELGSKTNIEETDTNLIKRVKEFIIEADTYELFKRFTNWDGEGKKVFNLPLQDDSDWIALRDRYIKMLPASEIINLERLIPKINMTGNVFEGSLKVDNEAAFLFSRSNNVKEYKNRLGYLLTALREVIKNINVSNTGDLKEIMDNSSSTKAHQIGDITKYISSGPIEQLNIAIANANKIIAIYIEEMKKDSNIIREWDNLINGFNSKYPFSSYLEAEPQEYKDKINKAIILTTSTADIEYKTEEGPKLNLDGSYYVGEVEVLTAEGGITNNTFTSTYKYFSDFYWKLVGEADGPIVVDGMLFWYIDVALQGEIEYQKNVLADMKVLLDEYVEKIANYNEKRNRYEKEYISARDIFEQYRIEYPDVFEYYASNSGDQYKLIDQAIADAKKYWNLFILELDLGYKREVERGMYG